MTKKQLAENVALEMNISYEDASKYVDAIFDIIKQSLAKGDKVQLIGFGTFEVRIHHGRTFFNPSTGQKHVVEDSKLPYFKVGDVLKRVVKSS